MTSAVTDVFIPVYSECSPPKFEDHCQEGDGTSYTLAKTTCTEYTQDASPVDFHMEFVSSDPDIEEKANAITDCLEEVENNEEVDADAAI